MITEKTDIIENDVWVAEFEFRRVVATLGGYVYYSSGGDHNGSCLKSTFSEWARKNKAELYEEKAKD